MRQILLLLCLSLGLSAQSWDSLRGLRRGDAVKLRETSGRQHKGQFAGFSPDAVTLEVNGVQMPFERVRVRRLEVRSNARRMRKLLIGVGIGTAVGVTVDQTLGTYFRNESGQSSGERALTYVVPIAVFGAIFGALPAYRTVYRAP